LNESFMLANRSRSPNLSPFRSETAFMTSETDVAWANSIRVWAECGAYHWLDLLNEHALY